MMPGICLTCGPTPANTRISRGEKPDIAKRLSEARNDWKQRLPDQMGKDDRPYPVGYAQFPATLLPARDGVPHGGVQRSAPAPNCSYFKNWKSTDDSITWDIEVATAGTYDATIFYTCPQADVGSTVELSFNGDRIEGTVAEAHDPPISGGEYDRVPRTAESYVKDFKPLRLGSIPLKPGRGLLTLRALRVPGKQVMEVRMVELTLKR